MVTGSSPQAAVRATIDLARQADEMGYHRYWLAEHHAMRGLADAAPEVLLARLAAETTRIRVGSGGVLLPHYSPLKVAEQFRMLEALTPGRIDLGIGRAPGGTPRVSTALESRAIERFPEQIGELIDFLDGTLPEEHRFATLAAMPSGPTSPPVWLLGSSEYSAALAAHRGLPFAFAHFISGDAEAVTQMYRNRFRPSAQAREPQVILAVAAIAAPSAAQAEELARTVDLWRLRIHGGINSTVPSLEEAQAYPYTLYEQAQIAAHRRRLTFGAPAAVRERLEAIASAHQADELMIVTIAPTYAARAQSYALLADSFELDRDAVPARG